MLALFLRPFVLLILAFTLLTLTSCNVEGFFTKIGDDPVFVDPDAAAAEVAAGGDAAGPGKAIYGRICAACHLGSGKGVPGNNIPSLAGAPLVSADPKVPVSIVLHGLRGVIERNGVTINGQMAAWKDQLSDDDIANVLTYVRSSFGNSAGPITAEEVATIRSETASRLAPFTEAELK